MNIHWPKPIALRAITTKHFLGLFFQHVSRNSLREIYEIGALLTSGIAKSQVALPSAT